MKEHFGEEKSYFETSVCGKRPRLLKCNIIFMDGYFITITKATTSSLRSCCNLINYKTNHFFLIHVPLFCFFLMQQSTRQSIQIFLIFFSNFYWIPQFCVKSLYVFNSFAAPACPFQANVQVKGRHGSCCWTCSVLKSLKALLRLDLAFILFNQGVVCVCVCFV